MGTRTRLLRRSYRCFHAYLCVTQIQRTVRRQGFKEAQRRFLKPWKPGAAASLSDPTALEEISWAVRWACQWRWQRSDCLYRALACYVLLQRAGVRPRFVTAVRVRPFASHAWTELDGEVVADESMAAIRSQYKPILSFPTPSIERDPSPAAIA